MTESASESESESESEQGKRAQRRGVGLDGVRRKNGSSYAYAAATARAYRTPVSRAGRRGHIGWDRVRLLQGQRRVPHSSACAAQ
jgi:hypothetical protein